AERKARREETFDRVAFARLGRPIDLVARHFRERQIAERELTRHGVAELAHVARPRIFEPSTDDHGRERLLVAAHRPPEVAREDRAVAAPMAGRGQLDRAGGEAKEEVLAKG